LRQWVTVAGGKATNARTKKDMLLLESEREATANSLSRCGMKQQKRQSHRLCLLYIMHWLWLFYLPAEAGQPQESQTEQQKRSRFGHGGRVINQLRLCMFGVIAAGILSHEIHHLHTVISLRICCAIDEGAGLCRKC